MNAVIEQVTYRYTCGCSATGGPLLPTYCPEHGTSEKPEPAVPVSALRVLMKYHVSKIDMVLPGAEIEGGPILINTVSFGLVMHEAELPHAWVLWRDLATLCDAQERKP